MKKAALILTLLCVTLSLCAQQKITTVKGYYRNGKYVQPHTRTYTSKSNKRNSKTIPDATILDLVLAIKEVKALNQHKPITKKGKNRIQIAATDTTDVIDIFYADVYILRYKDQVIDIISIPQDYRNFTPKYQFHKDKIPAEVAIELISDYNWNLYKDILSKTYYKSGKYKDPRFLTRTKEVVPIIIETEFSQYTQQHTTLETVTDTTNTPEVFYIDISILKYNETIIDIIPISREFSSLSGPTHELNKDQLPPEIILELVNKYHWKLNKNILSKTYYGPYHPYDPDPQSLKRTTEKIPIILNEE